jgi:hypothetical protein
LISFDTASRLAFSDFPGPILTLLPVSIFALAFAVPSLLLLQALPLPLLSARHHRPPVK